MYLIPDSEKTPCPICGADFDGGSPETGTIEKRWRCGSTTRSLAAGRHLASPLDIARWRQVLHAEGRRDPMLL